LILIENNFAEFKNWIKQWKIDSKEKNKLEEIEKKNNSF
jgi:hypothetical protein